MWSLVLDKKVVANSSEVYQVIPWAACEGYNRGPGKSAIDSAATILGHHDKTTGE
jgi:hypothetical protein